MDKETKHELSYFLNNFKQYVANNTYNSVVLTVTGTNWTTARGTFRPYKTIETSEGSDFAYRMTFTICGTLSVGAAGLTLTIAGVVFKNVANYYQPVYCVTNSASRGQDGAVTINTGQINLFCSDAATAYRLSADCELESWPTWADVII